MTELLERIERRFEEERKLEDIRCPYCGSVQDDETRSSHVTYWGEDEAKEVECDDCERKFMVKEEVTRHFPTKKMEDYNAKDWW